MPILMRVLKVIDIISDRSGKVIAWLLVFLVLELMYDVIARYVFGIATLWSYDISWMIGGTVYVFGAAYVLLYRGHVRIDIFYTRYSPKAKLIYDIILMLVFFFPGMIVWLWGSIDRTIYSVQRLEISVATYWQAPIYPMRILISIGIIFLMLQGIATRIRDVSSLMGHELPSEVAERKS